MNRSLLSALLLALGAVSARCDLRVPAYTAYIEPNPEGADVSQASGITMWTDNANKIVWTGYIYTPGQVVCEVSLGLPPGAISRLRLTVGGQAHDAEAEGAANGPVTAKFGSFNIAAAGYVRFALESLNASGGSFGDIDALSLGGPAAEGAHFALDPQRKAPYLTLSYPAPSGAKIAAFYCEATGVETPLCSYVAACGCNRAYLGMQVNSPTERRIIFSVWDAGEEKTDRSNVPADNRAILVAKGDGVQTNDFGNEGTGGHSHLVYPWKTGEKQRFLLTAKPVDETHTIYSGYYFHPEKKQWMLISSWKAPKAGDWLNGLYSFSEDFWPPNGQLRRKALYGNQWVLTADDQWFEITSAIFTDGGYETSRLDRFMGVEDGQFFLSSGGFIPGDTAFGQIFTRPAIGAHPADVMQFASPQSGPAAALHN